MFPRYAGRYWHLTGTGLLLLTLADSVLAAEPDKVLVSPLATLGKLAMALVVVLTVFWLFARIMRQFQGFQGGLHQSLKIVGALSVGQRERVVVIQAGDEQLVLGVTASQINTLHVLAQPLEQNTPSAEQGDFKAKLSAALKRQVEP